MRRLILEFSGDENIQIIREAQLQYVKSLEILHFLRHDKDKFAAIGRIEFEDPSSSVEDSLTGINLFKTQLLEQEKAGTYIVFIRSNNGTCPFSFLGKSDGYVVSPFEIREKKVKMTFLGSAKQVKDFLKKLEKRGMRHKIISLTDAKFSSDSLLNVLTEKQRKVLTTAYKLGYYDLPRRISSEQLSRKLDLHSSALVEHRRKAEQRLLARILQEQI